MGAIGEQQLEADANGEQQLKRMQSGPGAAADPKRMQAANSGRNRGASGRNRGAAALHRELSGARLLTVGERGGSYLYEPSVLGIFQKGFRLHSLHFISKEPKQVDSK